MGERRGAVRAVAAGVVLAGALAACGGGGGEQASPGSVVPRPPLAQMCWTLSDVISAHPPIRFDASRGQQARLTDAGAWEPFRAAIERAAADLAAIAPEVPDDLRDFHASLVAGVAATGTEVSEWPTEGSVGPEEFEDQVESLAPLLYVERYPGFPAFEAAYEADPASCPAPEHPAGDVSPPPPPPLPEELSPPVPSSGLVPPASPTTAVAGGG